MSTKEIRIYLIEEFRAQDQKEVRLVELGKQLAGRRLTAQELKPMLDGIEEVIDELQNLLDRCCEKFPDAEADGNTDPALDDL